MIFNAYSNQEEMIGGILPISAGHIFAKQGREIFRPHGRKDWLLFYIAKGSATFFLKEPTLLESGSFILFAPDEPQHHINQQGQSAEYYYIHFQCAALPQALGLLTSHPYHCAPLPKIADIFEEFIGEFLQKAPHFKSICSYSLLRLLALLARESSPAPAAHQKGFQKIAKAVQDMRLHFDEDRSLEDYAALCNMSKYHFLRSFRDITGQTPLSYRNEIRIHHGAELILEGLLSMEEISESLGFSSPAYFSAAFKKHFGLSPKQYKAKKNG